jgi:hypothetical protein
VTLSVVPLTNLLAIVVLLWHSAGKIAPLYKSVPPPNLPYVARNTKKSSKLTGIYTDDE